MEEHRMRRLAIPAAAFIFSAAQCVSAHAGDACEREMIRASRQHGVPIAVLYAVGLTESGRRSSMQPYVLNIDGRSQDAASVREALMHFEEARRRGAKLIDLGCMQINHYYHGHRFESVEAMLDPVKNVDYAARFLKELRGREGDWTRAVARYNAGPDNAPAQQRYVCRVIANLVASGLGSWTERARAFCQDRHQHAANSTMSPVGRQPRTSASPY
jgi:soluble lytic murein transglycosylase-like protein